MINEFISTIESLGVSLQSFTCLCIIFYILSKPLKWLIKKFFKGVSL